MMQGFCSLSLYVIVAPFLSIQAMCTWLLLYWIYKGALLRLAKRPNPEMTPVVNQVRGLPLSYVDAWKTGELSPVYCTGLNQGYNTIGGSPERLFQVVIIQSPN